MQQQKLASIHKQEWNNTTHIASSFSMQPGFLKMYFAVNEYSFVKVSIINQFRAFFYTVPLLLRFGYHFSSAM